jgi:hypothetical protein
MGRRKIYIREFAYLQCPLCSQDGKKYYQRAGNLAEHIVKVHGIDYCKCGCQYPMYIHLTEFCDQDELNHHFLMGLIEGK